MPTELRWTALPPPCLRKLPLPRTTLYVPAVRLPRFGSPPPPYAASRSSRMCLVEGPCMRDWFCTCGRTCACLLCFAPVSLCLFCARACVPVPGDGHWVARKHNRGTSAGPLQEPVRPGQGGLDVLGMLTHRGVLHATASVCQACCNSRQGRC